MNEVYKRKSIIFSLILIPWVLKPVPIFSLIRYLILPAYEGKIISEYDENLVLQILFSFCYYLFFYLLWVRTEIPDINSRLLYIAYYLLVYQMLHILFEQYYLDNLSIELINLFWIYPFVKTYPLGKKINEVIEKYFYLFLTALVYAKSPPFNFVRTADEWQKMGYGIKNIYTMKDPLSSFIAPISSRTILFETLFGGSYVLLGDRISFLLTRGLVIAFIAFSLSRLLKTLELNSFQSLIVVSIFFVQQDILGGNGIVTPIEEGLIAISLILLSISYWLENNYKKTLITLVLSCYFHIQFGVFWVGVFFISDLYNKSMSKAVLQYYLKIGALLSPLVAFLLRDTIRSGDPIVYAYGKKVSWVYSYIFQRFHLSPFKVSEVETPKWIINNWANGFSGLIFWLIVCSILRRVTSDKKTNCIQIAFLIYFPTSVLLSYIDTLIDEPGRIVIFFLFRQDTIFHLIFIALLVKHVSEKVSNFNNQYINIGSLVLILIIFTGLVTKNQFHHNKYLSMDKEIQNTYEFLNKNQYKYIVTPPEEDNALGGIEFQTRLSSFVSTKMSVNDLGSFNDWYERVELRGRFYNGECEVFYEYPIKIFIANENSRVTGCGEKIFSNYPSYSVYRVVENKQFTLPAFNGACSYTLASAIAELEEKIEETKLYIKIQTLYAEGPKGCEGKVFGSNLEQGKIIDSSIEDIVLVVGK